jgi:hypothetical protein
MQRSYLIYILVAVIFAASFLYVGEMEVFSSSITPQEKIEITGFVDCACRLNTFPLTVKNTGAIPVKIAEIIVNGVPVTGRNIPPDPTEIATDYPLVSPFIEPGAKTVFNLYIGNALGYTSVNVTILTLAGNQFTTKIPS